MTSASTVAPPVPFWRVLVTAIACFVLGGVILAGGFILYQGQVQPTGAPKAESRVWTGKMLRLVEGVGHRAGDALVVGALSGNGYALAAPNAVRINTDQYPFLSYDLKGLQAGTKAEFFWRTMKDPDTVHSIRLSRGGKGNETLALSQNASWKGAVFQFGVVLSEELPQPVRIESLELRPYSVAALLSAVWAEWTAFEGWDHKTINRILGPVSRPIVPLVPAVAAWAIVAFALYGIWLLVRRNRWDWRIAGAIFLLAWLVLDARWQVNLWRQLEITHDRYAGKSWEEKHLAAEDGELFAYAERLKREVLPKEPARIFLLHDSVGHDYSRLRAMYHLLPHNIYNYGKYPSPKHLKDRDYILVLDQIKGLRYQKGNQTLRWRKHGVLKVEQIDHDPLGDLYQFTHNAHKRFMKKRRRSR